MIEETAFIARANYIAKVVPQRTGILIAPAELGDRTGLGAKFEVTTPMFSGRWKNFITGEISGSTRLYNRTRIRIGGNPFVAQYGYDWRPQEQFFGVGMDSDDDSVTSYAAQEEHVRLGLNFNWNERTPDSRDFRTELLAWTGPRARIMRKGHEAGRPSYEELHPEAAFPTLDEQLEYLLFGGAFSTDWRSGQPHWSRGWRFSFFGEHLAHPPKWAALRTARDNGATFTRWDAQFETGFSFMRDPRSLRIFTRVVDQVIHEGAEEFVIADMVKLGGAQGLWGFEPGRFHDIDGFLTRVSYVFPLARRFEIDVHAEAGGVYPDVWEDLKVDAMEHSWGIYLRGRSATRPVGYFGADVSREGIRIRYRLGNIDDL
jgi:hypothetical protein